ncbi:IS3 family transposase [Nitrospirillum amazonense]|uniref:IS3 family transposase n=1 Tax=Nitrospirillum amazonense TaxID=28077 RepID=UPI002DD44DEE|nr:IS3 family transposase [Nitrospirillum amazonense]MEC4593810.1 IS3 family transposase [Nitrospirillum amazonense]
MGIARSTYYDVPVETDGDAMILDRMKAICAEFESYGYRRVSAELRHQGLVVNSKKVRRLMREHDLQPRRRRRFVATTDSDHDEPVFPNRAADMTLTGPDQLWGGDIWAREASPAAA